MKGDAAKIAQRKQERARRRDDPEVLENDRLDALALHDAVDAAVAQLRRCMERNPGREIRSLGRKEIEHVVIDAIAAWVTRRTLIEQGEELDAMLAGGPANTAYRAG